MSIFHAVAIVIMVIGLFNSKKGFLSFLLFATFLNQLINVINIPGVPLLTLKSFMALFFTVLYFAKWNSKTERRHFPLVRTYIYTTISYLLSLLLGYVEIKVGYSAIAKVFLEQFFMIWLLWLYMDNEKDIKFLGNGYLIIFSVAAIYGIFEHFWRFNPLTEYEMLFAGDNDDKIIDFTYDEDYGRGYRIKSIFYHALSAGFNFSLYVMFCIYFMFKRGTVYKMLTTISIALVLIAIVFVNSRTPLFFLFFSIVPFFYGKNGIRLLILLLISLITLLISLDKDSNLYRIILSFFDQKTSEDLGGSSVTARYDQFDATISIWSKSPLWGLGPKATSSSIVENDSNFSRLLGLESIWIWAAIERGLIGVTALSFYFFTLLKLARNNRKMIFLVISYTLTVSATSLPGSYDELFFVILFAHIKRIV